MRRGAIPEPRSSACGRDAVLAALLRAARSTGPGPGGRALGVVVAAGLGSGNLIATGTSFADFQAPVNTSPPTIMGTARQGQMLTEQRGVWRGPPTDYTYRWLRCDSSSFVYRRSFRYPFIDGCTAIAGAINPTYVPVAEDVGHTLRILEVASGWFDPSASAVSSPTSVVQAGAPVAPSPPATATPLVIATKSVTVNRRGVALISARCPTKAANGCKGTITIRLDEPVARRARALAARCGRGCRPIGSAHYEARAGRRLDVRVHIASYARHLLTHRKALRVTLTATSFSAGKAATVVRTLLLLR
jgi:hypothetical protein